MSLTVSHLSKRFGSKQAVSDLSFSMEKPGIFGLIGTNGAGKTTTIRMILGIMPADSGTSLWDGKQITRETLQYGYMPEERGLYMKTGVLEQLTYFGMLRGMNKSDARTSAIACLRRLHIEEYKDMLAEKLSKGNQQKVQLAATLVHNPKQLFLDEPFSGLDPVNAEILQELLYELVEEGKFIVMSSHQMTTVEEYCENCCPASGSTLLTGNLRKSSRATVTPTWYIGGPQAMELAEQCGLKLLETRADETEYKITGDDMANTYLRALLDASVYPVKYEIKEPSLREIFIAHVEARTGEKNADTEENGGRAS